MTASIGRIIARLAEPNEPVPSHLVTMINRNVKPPEPVTGDEVHIRSMYIVSDRVNSFGGRFPVEEHQRLAELLVDSPVLIGHRKDKLPVGRNFHAITTERNGRPWVRSYFYWLRSAEGADHLAENIDGGIYKECSVAFTFSLPECSICGKDIRLCPHQPLHEYSRLGRKEVCHFNYRQIERVLETSLVYRGAVPETSMSKELAAKHPANPSTAIALSDLNCSSRYIVIPRYDAIEVDAHVADGRLIFSTTDGSPLGAQAGQVYQPSGFNPARSVRGLLVGYRGKDRCTSAQTRAFLERQTGPVSRLVLNVLPGQGLDRIPEVKTRSALDVRLIPQREVPYDQINRAALEIKTREGVELWPADVNPAEAARLVFHPSVSAEPSAPAYALRINDDTREASLSFRSTAAVTPQTFRIPYFNLIKLAEGRRFAAWPTENTAVEVPAPTGDHHSPLLSVEKDGDAVKFKAKGVLDGVFMLRPMKLNGREGYLLSRFGGVMS